MAYSRYSQWLLKVGDYIIPTQKYIAADSYIASAYMQDLDPWTDANGYLHRNAVKLKALKVEFQTPAMLTDEELAELIYNIDKNIVDPIGNEYYITAYVPRYNQYFTQRAYMVDIDSQLYGNYGGKIHYDPIRFAFVGGLYND